MNEALYEVSFHLQNLLKLKKSYIMGLTMLLFITCKTATIMLNYAYHKENTKKQISGGSPLGPLVE